MSAGAAKVLEFPPGAQSKSRFLLPREHGSWALWLLPLISGGIVGYVATPAGAVAPSLWLLLVAFSAFMLRQPLEALLGISVFRLRSLEEQRIAVYWVMGLTVVATLGILELLLLQRSLILVLGLAALLCFGLSALCRQRRALRIPKQIIGALGLSVTGAGAYYVTAGHIDRTALLLWLGAWLFAVSQIEYVQLRLRTANIKSRLGKAAAGWKVAVLHLALLGAGIVAAIIGLPTALAVAFVPATARMFTWMFRPLRPLKLYVLGFSELFQSVAFNALLTAAFLVRR